MPSKMERFTQRSRRVLSLAQEEAERMQHSAIDTEHLLLGLMREEGGVAHRVLTDLGATREGMEKLAQDLSKVGSRTGPQLDLTSEVKKTLELAVDEARRMGHHYIGTEHLLLGLLRQGNSTAMTMLQRQGIAPSEITRQVRRVLNEVPKAPQIEHVGSPLRSDCDVFTILPAEDSFLALYNDHIKPVINSFELTVKRAGDAGSEQDVSAFVLSSIASARFVIADCSHKDPEVFYQLGIVGTLGKPVILLTQSMDDLPVALREKSVLVYENTPEGLQALQSQLREAIERVSQESE